MSTARLHPTNADYFDVPEFFATDVGLVEDAGDGNMRVVRCVKRSGILFPVYSLITPTSRMICNAQAVRDAAVRIQVRFDHAH